VPLDVQTVGDYDAEAVAFTLLLTRSLRGAERRALDQALTQWFGTSSARFGVPAHMMSEIAFMDDDGETAEWWMDLGEVDVDAAISSIRTVIDRLVGERSFPASRLLVGWRE
jgi:hypothetical protein